MNGESIHPVFDSVVGHRGPLGLISRAMAAGRLAHGLLFAGPDGVGRKSAAYALSAWFLSEKPDDSDAIARTRHLIDLRTHPDFHFVTRELVRDLEGKSANKASELSVDVIREFVVVPAAKKSVIGVGKVFVIDQADLMTTAAQNALLKTLEEPAGRTLIILITTAASAILSTIRSRTQHFTFAPLAEADVLEVLRRNKVDAATAAAGAKIAAGSPGRAMKLLSDGVLPALNQFYSMLDAAERKPEAVATFLAEESARLAERQLERDPKSSKDAATRDAVVLYLALAADRLRTKLREADSDETIDTICGAIEALRVCEANVDSNVNLSLSIRQAAAALA